MAVSDLVGRVGLLAATLGIGSAVGLAAAGPAAAAPADSSESSASVVCWGSLGLAYGPYPGWGTTDAKIQELLSAGVVVALADPFNNDRLV